MQHCKQLPVPLITVTEVVYYIQKKMFTALAAELKARDDADGVCHLCDPNTEQSLENWLA